MDNAISKNTLVGALIRKFWPGFYTPVPNGERKLATSWAHYEAAENSGYAGKAFEAVITKFWVRQSFRVSFIVDDPTMLTYDPHNILYV